MRAIVGAILRSAGITDICEASHGGHALALLTNSPADVAIVDYQMSPMDGLEFTDRLRNPKTSPRRSLPVIMMTGYADRTRVVEARRVASASSWSSRSPPKGFSTAWLSRCSNPDRSSSPGPMSVLTAAASSGRNVARHEGVRRTREWPRNLTVAAGAPTPPAARIRQCKPGSKQTARHLPFPTPGWGKAASDAGALADIRDVSLARCSGR
jgi:CheY-like chemotaxis protein